MKLWVPIAVAGIIIAAYVLFYLITANGSVNSSSFGLVNSVGLASVFVALVGAGLIIKRAKPHQ